MRSIRRLSYAALVIAFAQIVFGAIVRITGSGWGCGEHWPKCAGYWLPPLERPDLIIEVSHRYLALGVTLVTLALAIVAWRRRRETGVAGRGGPLRPAIGAFAIVIATALLGMVTIKLRLNPIVIVLHLALAMTLLATIIVAGIRAGGFGVARATLLDTSDVTRAGAARTWRVARIAVILAFTVLVLGALTANLGAAGACLGFPTCRVYSSPNRGLVHLQLTHRILAFLFALHVLGAAMMIRRRAVAPIVKRAVWLALGAIVVQIIVAASLVELRLPPVLQSLHQAVGTLVWVAVVIWASLANRAAGSEPAVLMTGSPAPVPADGSDRVVRRPEPVTAGSPLLVSSPSIDAGAIARFGELDRAGRAYEAAIAALVAEAEAVADSFDESLVVVTTEHEVPEAAAAPAAPAAPACDPNYDQYVTNSTACGEVDASAVVAPLPEPDPVALPNHVATPAQPMPAIERPHSVAVIVARGADF
jgi:heme A synthase